MIPPKSVLFPDKRSRKDWLYLPPETTKTQNKCFSSYISVNRGQQSLGENPGSKLCDAGLDKDSLDTTPKHGS